MLDMDSMSVSLSWIPASAGKTKRKDAIQIGQKAVIDVFFLHGNIMQSSLERVERAKAFASISKFV